MPVPAASPAHTPNFRQHYLHQVAGLNVLTRLGIALAVCALCWGLAPADFRLGTRAIAAWDGFCVAILGLTWVATVTAAPADATGLADRGRIAPGLRADLVRVARTGTLTLPRGTWVGGIRVA